MKIWPNSGIYQIRNTINDKIYIGSSTDIKARQDKHISSLGNNKHENNHLQHAYNKYGITAFEHTIIMTCPPIKNILLFFEQHYLDIYWDGGKDCYNILKIAGSPLGMKRTEEQRLAMSIRVSGNKHPQFGKVGSLSPSFGKKHSKEQGLIHSARFSGKNHPMYGKHPSEETRAKLRIAQSGENHPNTKLTWEYVRKIRAIYIIGDITRKELADKYNVSVGHISDILNNKKWKE